MKRKISAALLTALIMTAGGCLDAEKAFLKTANLFGYESESQKIAKESTELLRCLEENDRDGLRAMFCKAARELSDFEEKLDRLFELVGSGATFTDTGIDTSAGGGKSVRQGETTSWDVHPHIDFVVASYPDGSSRYFWISYEWQIVYRDDPDYEGIHALNLNYLNVELLRVGEYFKLD